VRALRGLAFVLSLGVLAATSASGSAPATASRPEAQGTVTKFLPGGSLSVPSSLAAGLLTFDRLSGGIAADTDGTVYVGACASDNSNRIVVFDRGGHYLRDFRAGNCGTGEPVRIAVGPDHLLYATRTGPNNEIGVFDSTGAQVRLLAGIGQYETITARDIDLDAKGNVYVTIRCESCGTDSDEVVRLSQSGQVTGRWQPLPPPYLCNGQCVYGVAPAPDGTVWVTTNDPKRKLVHLDAQGKPLPDPPHLDVLLPGLMGGYIRDVDFANGRLYIVGETKAFAVLMPDGRLVDSICCEHTSTDVNRQVAVSGTSVYVPGIQTSTSTFRLNAPPQSVIGKLDELHMREPKSGDAEFFNYEDTCSGTGFPLTEVPFGSLDSGCGQHDLVVVNRINPCKANGITNTTSVLPGSVFVGGSQVIPAKFVVGPGVSELATPGSFAAIVIPKSELAPGSIVVTYTCKKRDGGFTQVSEWKGELTKTDPSGKVVDRASGKPVEGARVQLQFSPGKSGPFVRPGLGGISPQLVTETTGRDGVFRWNVADGFWRLKVTAFGYRPLTSAPYRVPPPATGLVLKLRPNPAQQRLLIDPRGRVGGDRLGGQARRVAGLRLRVAGGRVRAIVVVSTQFRTALGISVGSRASAFDLAYPAAAAKAARAARGKLVNAFHLLRATFRVRGGRIVGITLGR
jgi:hypothetical protein